MFWGRPAQWSAFANVHRFGNSCCLKIESKCEWISKKNHFFKYFSEIHLHQMHAEYRSRLSYIQNVIFHFVCIHDIDNDPNPSQTMYKMLHSIRLANANCVALQKPNFVSQYFVATMRETCCKCHRMVSDGQWTFAWVPSDWYNIHWAMENASAAQNDETPIRRDYFQCSTPMPKILTVQKEWKRKTTIVKPNHKIYIHAQTHDKKKILELIWNVQFM